ncbi:unnamed protein product [Oppiella nova]|uniref:Uncharacterized protein n=1 Tax=Oppiella nova TaxID=334625 RepID=A0A7R9MMF2_9ACAR|nr:unnamed protein product [Oppiella nova]CAG2179684.1 unnamed protein product [Oppiella nova]
MSTKLLPICVLIVCLVYGINGQYKETPIDLEDPRVTTCANFVATAMSNSEIEYVVDTIWDANTITGSDIDIQIRVILAYFNLFGCRDPSGCERQINCNAEVRGSGQGPNPYKLVRIGCSPTTSQTRRRRKMSNKKRSRVIKRMMKSSKDNRISKPALAINAF